MKHRVHAIIVVFAVAFFAFAALSLAATGLNPAMQALLDGYRDTAKVMTFSPDAGRRFYAGKRTHSSGEARSCATCHTENPSASGKTPAGKVIEPISPAVNKSRFTDPKKVEKWFTRNCKWVLERECTDNEKGDYIAFMLSL